MDRRTPDVKKAPDVLLSAGTFQVPSSKDTFSGVEIGDEPMVGVNAGASSKMLVMKRKAIKMTIVTNCSKIVQRT